MLRELWVDYLTCICRLYNKDELVWGGAADLLMMMPLHAARVRSDKLGGQADERQRMKSGPVKARVHNITKGPSFAGSIDKARGCSAHRTPLSGFTARDFRAMNCSAADLHSLGLMTPKRIFFMDPATYSPFSRDG